MTMPRYYGGLRSVEMNEKVKVEMGFFFSAIVYMIAVGLFSSAMAHIKFLESIAESLATIAAAM